MMGSRGETERDRERERKADMGRKRRERNHGEEMRQRRERRRKRGMRDRREERAHRREVRGMRERRDERNDRGGERRYGPPGHHLQMERLGDGQDREDDPFDFDGQDDELDAQVQVRCNLASKHHECLEFPTLYLRRQKRFVIIFSQPCWLKQFLLR